jgi:hypothetical protein
MDMQIDPQDSSGSAEPLVQVSKSTLNHLTSFKYRLSHYYNSLLEETAERNKRMADYDTKIGESGYSDEKKQRFM